MGKILVIGANGQVGTELIMALRKKHGGSNVISSDIRERQHPVEGPFRILDATDAISVRHLVVSESITEVYLMAAMLSAVAEKNPDKAWALNMDSLFIVLELAKEGLLEKIFWPSTIAVFGPNSIKQNTPQHGILEPTTVYGMSKLAGEHWCAYYNRRYGVDVRSLRYPGLIGYKSLPGGGTTDYAVDIFHKAVEKSEYTCFLSENRTLPMMYMEDAIRASLMIMDAPRDSIKERHSYNLAALSFSPKELAREIQVLRPNFTISYEPDFREQIAASWPEFIDDSAAREDWKWAHKVDLKALVNIMLEGVESLEKA